MHEAARQASCMLNGPDYEPAMRDLVTFVTFPNLDCRQPVNQPEEHHLWRQAAAGKEVPQSRRAAGYQGTAV